MTSKIILLIILLWFLGITILITCFKLCQITIIRSRFRSLLTPPDPDRENATRHQSAQLQIENNV